LENVKDKNKESDIFIPTFEIRTAPFKALVSGLRKVEDLILAFGKFDDFKISLV